MRPSILHLPVPRSWTKIGRHALGKDVDVYQRMSEPGTHLTITIGRDRTMGLHLTVTHRHNVLGPGGIPVPGRYPTVAEIREVLKAFIPDQITMALVFPEERIWAEAHPSTCHLYEVVRPYSVPPSPPASGGTDVVAGESGRPPARPERGPLVLAGSDG